MPAGGHVHPYSAVHVHVYADRWAKSLEEVRRDFEFDGYQIT